MVCPLVILTEVDLTEKSGAFSGLYKCEYAKPEWWSPAPVATPSIEDGQAAVVPARPYPSSLFDDLHDDKTAVEEPKKPVAQPKVAKPKPKKKPAAT